MTAWLKAPLALSLIFTASFTHNAAFVGDHSAIVRVDCEEGTGTAFRVGKHTLLSVRHVTGLSECTINGEPFKVVYNDPKRDFSVLESDADGEMMGVDCNGFVRGKKYLAIGYARGLDETTVVEIEGTGQKVGKLSLLSGTFTVIPGQSGGPIMDEDSGKVVGTVNTFDYEDGISGSTPLSDTVICHA